MRLHELILEKLVEIGEGTLDVFFPAKYPEARLWRSLLGLDPRYQFSRRSFSTILSRLRREGLVEREGRGPGARWRITASGGEVRTLDGMRGSAQYLVVFDIPELERRKRGAIRSELVVAGYVQFQKSVWIGTKPLPERFIELLDQLDLFKRVHIFGVRSQGTFHRSGRGG